MKLRISIVVCLCFVLFGCTPTDKKEKETVEKTVEDSASKSYSSEGKILGASLEMPPNRIGPQPIEHLKSVNAEWVAMIPYGFTPNGTSEVRFGYPGQWWGESEVGTLMCIRMAKNAGLKVMLKPHVWVQGQGWPGKFEPKSERAWKAWENTYREYILAFARLADSSDVDLFCVGTEYRIAIDKRPDFWKKLIKEVKEVYSGPVTYAANWDNFQKVTFWEELDYIGVDAYFPLLDDPLPAVEDIKKKWKPVEDELGALSKKTDRPILFTEYGYMSVEYTNSGHWKHGDTVKVSMQAQANAYRGLFESIWQQDWMAGGFFWKWHLNGYKTAGGPKNRRYTPQNKLAAEVIKEWYGK